MTKETAEFTLPKAGSVSVQMGGSEGDTVTSKPAKGVSIGAEDLEKKLQEEDDKENGNDADAQNGEVEGADPDADGADADGAKGDEGDGDDADADATLPEAFTADDPEVVKAFDAKYTKDGAFVEEALSAEYFANLDAGKDGLNDATYDYLASKGIPKSMVKNIEAMAATKRDAENQSVEAQDLKLFDIAGGPEELQKALEWGKKGGYSKEWQDRFNAITKGKDLEAKQEAVAALMYRFRRANPQDRPRLPSRDATKGAGKTAQGLKPYTDRAEMRKVRDSLAQGDKAGWEAHNRRLAISKFVD